MDYIVNQEQIDKITNLIKKMGESWSNENVEKTEMEVTFDEEHNAFFIRPTFYVKKDKFLPYILRYHFGDDLATMIRSLIGIPIYSWHPEFIKMNLNENISRIKEQSIFPFQHGKEFSNIINDFFKNATLIKNVYQEVKSYSDEIYSDNNNLSNLKKDAFRHILASAYISSLVGSKITNVLGWLNEFAGAFKGLLLSGNFDSGWAMDDANNRIGINIGSKTTDKNKIKSEVKKVIDTGNFFIEDGKKLFKNSKKVS